MTASQDEDERRRIIAELKELVRGSRATSQAEDGPPTGLAPRADSEELKKHLRPSHIAKQPEDGPLAGPAYLVSGQEDSQKIVRETLVRHSTLQEARDPIDLRGFQSQKRGLHSNFATTAELLGARRQEAVSAPSEASRSDVLRDGNDESKNPRHEHENNFSDSVGVANVEVRSRRYLLVLAAIVVVFGLAGLAASLDFRSATSGRTETPTIGSEAELAKLQPEGSTGADAPAQDASIIDASPQPSPRMLVVDKAEQSINASRAEEKAPSIIAPGGESGSATEAASVPAPSAQMQTQAELLSIAAPLEPMKILSVPVLPAGAFSANEAPPQDPATVARPLTRPAAPTAKRPNTKPEQIANTQAGAPAPQLISTPATSKLEPISLPKSAAKEAPLPPSRPAPTAQPAKANAGSNAKQERVAHTGAGAQTPQPAAVPAETGEPSEFILQRALDALFEGSEHSNP